MLTRAILLCAAIALVATVLPTPAAPVDEASAYCLIWDPDLGCVNPGCTVARAYNTAREESGLDDKLPPAYCPA